MIVVYSGSVTGSGDQVNVGFSHMSAAILAVKHFNQRNSKIVPELGDLTKGCNITFDMELSQVFDTESITHKAARDVQRANITPCALVGGWTNLPTSDLAVLAHSLEIPLVAHRAENVRVTDPRTSPFATLVYPDLKAEVQASVNYLRFIGRNDYISILYPQTESGVQKREAWGALFNTYDMNYMSSGYHSTFKGKDLRLDDVYGALKNVKASGYRTVVIVTENAVEEIPALADAADALQMNAGEYLFFISGFTSEEGFQWSNQNITNLLDGAVAVLPIAPDEKSGARGAPFLQSWSDDFEDILDIVRSKNPIGKGRPGYVELDNTTFQSVPSFGSTFLYDAVIAVGIGACLARVDKGRIIGTDHLRGVHKVNFTGSTGRLGFGGNFHVKDRENTQFDSKGSRSAGTLQWSAWSLHHAAYPNMTNDPIEHAILVGLTTGEEGTWETVRQPIFRDGRLNPPDLLRDLPNQNYLSGSLRVAGFAFMGIVIFISIALSLWVFVNRNRRVVKAAQPFFLYLICFGSAIEASCVWMISFDENRGWSEERLSTMCASAPWCYVIGHSLVYGSLSTKLYRVHRVLQFSRRQVKVQQVIGPMVALLVIALSILLIWTLVDPLYWNRGPGDPITGESFGTCQTLSLKIFAPLEMFVLAIPTIMTAWMAWRTRDVDEVYTESWWIFVMILAQIELVIIGAPIIVILSGVSTDGRYLGLCLMILGFPATTLLLIFGPKIYLDHLERNGTDQTPSKRGAQQGVRVTGISTPNASPGFQGANFGSHISSSPQLLAGSPMTSRVSSTTTNAVAGIQFAPVVEEDANQSEDESSQHDSSLVESHLTENGINGDT